MNRLWNLWRVEPPPGPPMWVPVLGQLQRTLRQGDYLPLRPLPMFESDFVQVTSRGAPVYVHHSSNHLTMGVAASLPGAPLPDLLLIARPSEDRGCPNLLLSRMIPLAQARLYVHSQPARCLKLRLLTGRYYYLELNAPDREMAFLFRRWVRLISLLQEAAAPGAPGAPGALSTSPSGLAQATPPASTWQLQDQPHRSRSATAAGPLKMLAAPKQKEKASRPGPDRGALHPEPSAAAPPSRGRFRSRAVGDSVPLVWSQLEPLGSGKRAGEKSHPDLGHGSQTKPSGSAPPLTSQEPSAPAKPSVTIRTIFSIFSRSFSPSLSSPQGCSADRAAMLGGLAEAPSCCLSHGPEASLLVSYKQLYVQGTLGGLADPDSDIPSSCSLGPTAYRPASYPPARPASGPRQGGQPGPPRPVQTPRPPPAQRAPLKHPQKAPADPAPSQKPPAGPAAPKKTGVLAPAPRKAPRVPAAPQNTSSAPVLCLEPLSLPTPSSQALTPRTRYRTAWDSAASGAGPAGSQPSGKTEPLMLVGAQETEVTEVRARKMSLELPGHTARREREEVVVGRARELALDGLRGRGQVEDPVRSSREERRVDLPGFRSQATGQRREWVRSQQLAVDGAPGGPRRPFSVLMLKAKAKAKAKEPPSGPRPLGLPSWLLMSQVSAGSARGPEPLGRRRGSMAEGSPGGARGAPTAPRLGSWVEGGVGLWMEETRRAQASEAEPEKLPWAQRGPSTLGPRAPSTPRSSKVDRVSEAPIPPPAMRWEDALPPSPTVLTPISQMEAARTPLKLNRDAVGTQEGGSGRGSVAKAGLPPETGVPKLLELEKMGGVAGWLQQSKESPQVLTPWPRH